jgi:hypothetical protein
MLFVRSWRLFGACWQVLRTDPQLIAFPTIAGLSYFLILVIFTAPLLVTGYFTRVFDGAAPHWTLYALLVLLSLTLHIVANVCSAALVAAAFMRLNGRQPSIGRAFDLVWARLPAILGFSLIAVTVGAVLSAIEQRAGFLGFLISRVLGIAWAVSTFMVVPVLVVEGVGPIDGIKRSAALLKRTWGERCVINVGLGLATGLALLSVASTAFLLFSLTRTTILGVPLLVATLVVGITVISILAKALTGIYTAALYGYATGRGVLPGFQADIISGAFKTK